MNTVPDVCNISVRSAPVSVRLASFIHKTRRLFRDHTISIRDSRLLPRVHCSVHITFQQLFNAALLCVCVCVLSSSMQHCCSCAGTSRSCVCVCVCVLSSSVQHQGQQIFLLSLDVNTSALIKLYTTLHMKRLFSALTHFHNAQRFKD